MNGLRDRAFARGTGRGRGTDFSPVELPPRSPWGAPDRPADPAPRLVTPRAPAAALSRVVFRIVAGSLGLALAVGIGVGRLTASEGASSSPGAGPAEVRVRGAGHLGALSGGAISGSSGLLTDADAIRDRLLATGVPKNVSVERVLPGGVLVEVEEKRAVALLDGEPPQALAGDGTVLGPATAADFTWAGVTDLVVVRGALPIGAGFTERAALAGRLATALRSRPDLDRLVSELDVSDGPFRVRLVLRSSGRTVLLTEAGFVEGLERVTLLLPDLVARWPGLSRVDARVPDRLLLRSDPPGGPAHSVGGQT